MTASRPIPRGIAIYGSVLRSQRTSIAELGKVVRASVWAYEVIRSVRTRVRKSVPPSATIHPTEVLSSQTPWYRMTPSAEP